MRRPEIICRNKAVGQSGWRALALLGCLALCKPGTAYAEQVTPAENIAAARELGLQGIALADAGKCDEAIEKLTRAEALYHAPTILSALGECQVQVGQIVLGTENLNRVAREELPANAPQAFRDAQARAREVLPAALARIARLVIRVEPAEAKPVITVSGKTLPSELIGVERPTDPGTHEITVTASGFVQTSKSVNLTDGSREELVLSLQRAQAPTEPVVSRTASAPAALVPAKLAASDTTSRSRVAAYALFGLAGAGIVVGSISGIAVLKLKADLNCQQKVCPESEQDEYDRAVSFATLSTVTFVVAGAAALGGGLLLYTTQERSSSQTGRPRRGFSAGAALSRNGVQLFGSF